jgi:hypothetical protein
LLIKAPAIPWVIVSIVVGGRFSSDDV